MYIVKLDKKEFGKLLKKDLLPLYGKIDGSNVTLNVTSDEFVILLKTNLFPIFDSYGNLLNNFKSKNSNKASDDCKPNIKKSSKKAKKGFVKRNSRPHKRKPHKNTKSKKPKQKKKTISRKGILNFIGFIKRK